MVSTDSPMINNPASVAVDGSNNAWIVGYSATSGLNTDVFGEYSVILDSNRNISLINNLAEFAFLRVANPFPHYQSSVSIDSVRQPVDCE